MFLHDCTTKFPQDCQSRIETDCFRCHGNIPCLTRLVRFLSHKVETVSVDIEISRIKTAVTHDVCKTQLAANDFEHSAIHATRTYYTPDSCITDLYTASVG
ncbi:hypothetical protein OS493_007579 [Desmophyllum pertusum]|uniref:Uncharacterized protein n=1 Tax=Desmophyllum pertusum TaxID=174260 RepID=A0A9X0CSJ5_9CNID|nr:hypothetical protein OS493_007579 [Desmophyllum pertusum]